MTDLSTIFQLANCPIGLLVFSKNEEGEWVCSEANKRAEILLENSILVTKVWQDIFQNLSIEADAENLVFQKNEQKYVSLSLVHERDKATCAVFINDVSVTQTHIKTIEQKVDRLKNSNKDLEHFAYVASHDLKEPLRKIVAFGERLNKKYGDILEGDGQIYLSRMIGATQRMQTFIEDLLTFSRFSRDTTAKEALDLNDILRGVLSDFDMQIESSQAVLDMDNLPTIKGVKTQIVQLFQNLVGNALKFKNENSIPHITIKSTELKESYQIIVRDNGIGFEEADAERIFVIFQRLNGRSEYEGTGIGLAICKKIVENHGGNIVAYSQPNEGAEFTITLPKMSV